METKRNLKYFTAPAISVLALIGWGVVAVGVIMLFIRYLRLYGLLVTIAGLVFVVCTSGGKSTDTDLEYQISERVKNLQELSEKKNEVYEKNFLKMLKPINLRGYDYIKRDGEEFYYKKGSDGKGRTNYFIGANLIFTSEKMYVYARRFSLIDESIDETTNASFFFNDLSKATCEEKIFQTKKGERTIDVKYYVFTIFKNDGTPALSMCVDYGADIDKYADLISRAIVTRQKELAKRAEEAAVRRAEFRAKVEAEKAAQAKAALENN